MAISTQVATAADSARYYIVRRPDNTMIPLIPADQLPISVQGIPKILTHRQMSDEGWKFVDETYSLATLLPLKITERTTFNDPATHSSENASSFRENASKFRAPDRDFKSSIYKKVSRAQPSTGTQPIAILSDAEKVTAPSPRPQSSLSPRPYGTQSDTGRLQASTYSAQSLSDDFAKVYANSAQRLGYRPNPSGIEPDHNKKVYCTHWIKTGECNFIAQGCKYKHEIPPMEELRKIGFTQVPQWYKEKQALTRQGPTWMQQRRNQLKKLEEEKNQEEEEDKDEDETSQVSMPPHDVLSDPSEARNMKLEAHFRARTAASSSAPPPKPETRKALTSSRLVSQRPPVNSPVLIAEDDEDELEPVFFTMDEENSIPATPSPTLSPTTTNTTPSPNATNDVPEPAKDQQQKKALPAPKTYSRNHTNPDTDQASKTAKQQLSIRKVYPGVKVYTAPQTKKEHPAIKTGGLGASRYAVPKTGTEVAGRSVARYKKENVQI
ncbi:unnamed protein product [Periconia digitata]|uniref:C3H1-type domain-containing protein n=1 Tax=Periconia digitata TaxID=1303443 RepID=A0A9W4XFY7_9PLEO|nr:unnamed protein product [Periconia digitata]